MLHQVLLCPLQRVSSTPVSRKSKAFAESQGQRHRIFLPIAERLVQLAWSERGPTRSLHGREQKKGKSDKRDERLCVCVWGGGLTDFSRLAVLVPKIPSLSVMWTTRWR
jgi:hypothetical protein